MADIKFWRTDYIYKFKFLKHYEYINVKLKVAQAFKLREFQRLHLETSSGCNQLRSLVFVTTSVKKPASCTWVVKEVSKSFTVQVLRISFFISHFDPERKLWLCSVFKTIAQCPVVSKLDKLFLKVHQCWECHQSHLRHHGQIGSPPICFQSHPPGSTRLSMWQVSLSTFSTTFRLHQIIQHFYIIK
jgi:hypothetical protein